MKYKKGEIFLLVFNLIYIAIFSFYYISIKNYEFLWYIAVVLFFIGLIWATLKKTKFDYFILGGLSLWGLLHMLGGGLRVGDGVLYSLHLIPIFDGGTEFFVLKFDQVVHALGFGVATLLMIHLLMPAHKKGVSLKMIYFAGALAGMGLGALNEIVEFIAVVVSPETGVGGYYNTALDLVANFFGALVAVGVAWLRRNKYNIRN